MRWEFPRKIKMQKILARVDARIRPAAAYHLDRYAQDRRKSILYRLLYTDLFGLDLPAEKVGPFISQFGEIAHVYWIPDAFYGGSRACLKFRHAKYPSVRKDKSNLCFLYPMSSGRAIALNQIVH
jgi:hypothetical protein